MFALRGTSSEFRVLVYFARLLTASVDLRSITNWNSRAQVPTTRLWVLPGGTKCSPNLFSLHLQHLYGTGKIDTEMWHHVGEGISQANSSNANDYLVNDSNKRDATKTIRSGNDYTKAKCQIRSYTSKRPFAVINDATSSSNAQFTNVFCHVSNLILKGWGEKTHYFDQTAKTHKSNHSLVLKDLCHGLLGFAYLPMCPPAKVRSLSNLRRQALELQYSVSICLYFSWPLDNMKESHNCRATEHRFNIKPKKEENSWAVRFVVILHERVSSSVVALVKSFNLTITSHCGFKIIPW